MIASKSKNIVHSVECAVPVCTIYQGGLLLKLTLLAHNRLGLLHRDQRNRQTAQQWETMLPTNLWPTKVRKYEATYIENGLLAIRKNGHQHAS